MTTAVATGAVSPKVGGIGAAATTMAASRSPFRDAMTKGVLSGSGMLTF